MMIEAYQAGLSTGGRQRASIAGGRRPVGKPCKNHELTGLTIQPREKFKDLMPGNLKTYSIINALNDSPVYALPTHFTDEPKKETPHGAQILRDAWGVLLA